MKYTTEPGSDQFLDFEVNPDGSKKKSTEPAPDPGPILADLPPAELSEEHKKILKQSAIDPEIARERGYRTVTDRNVLILFGFDPQQVIVPTLLIPYHSVTGEVGNVQSRPDVPRVSEQKNKPIKYEFPARSRMLLDIHPRSLPHIGNPTVPLFISEGSKKADSLLSAGAQCVVGVSGIWNTRGKNECGGLTILADWEYIALKERIVYIVFDSDVIKKQNKNAESRLAAFLRFRGANVKIVRLPPLKNGTKQGADDFLVTGKTLADLLTYELRGEDKIDEKPQFDGIPEGFELNEKGIFFVEDKEGDNGVSRPEYKWIAGPILVESLARDERGSSWGRVLKFHDPDGVLKKWVMPVELLKGNGEEVRGVLLSMGATLSPIPSRRPLLNQYLQSCRPKSRVRCVSKIGWSGDHYVLPDQTYSPESSEGVLFQSEEGPGDQDFSISGTLEDWQREISRPCIGNSRLVFGASIPFAGPLLELSGSDSGGFHFYGSSSTGKTTLQRVASSVCGPKDFLKGWRTTDNGLEGLLSRRNDAAIILDELGQLDPRIAGQSAYLISNGSAKSRAARSGGLRHTATWRTILLSSGEVDLPTHILSGGQKVRPGHLVRIIDIPAEVSNGTCFEDFHDSPNGPAFADRMKEASSKYYGTSLRAYLEILTTKKETVADLVQLGRKDFLKNHLPTGSEGQVIRVAERFALVAIAGELATYFGVTGWPPDESEKAAAVCFNAWLQARGGIGNRERDLVLSQVRAFFEANGSSRFEPMDTMESVRIINRVGFRNEEAGTATFYVLPESYKNEVLAGLDRKVSTRILIEAGWLEVGSAGKASQLVRLPGLGQKRVYAFSHKVFGEAE